MWFKILSDGKVVICSTNQTKTYQDIFKAIDGLYYTLNNLMQKEGRTKKTEVILTLLADIIKARNWDSEEIKNAILFLEEALKAKKVSEIESFVNRTFICLRRIKTTPKIATLINYNYYSPENSDLTIAKIRIQNLKKELEEWLLKLSSTEKVILNQETTKPKNQENNKVINNNVIKAKKIKLNTFLVKTKNIKGEDLYLIVHVKNNKVTITSRFVLKEKLNYQDLEISEEDEEVIKEAIEAIIEK